MQKFVKGVMSGEPPSRGRSRRGAGLVRRWACCRWPKVDFSSSARSRASRSRGYKKISGANLHRNWVLIPHVTNHDDADITDLEAFRVQLNKENEKSGVKITMLAFLIKASVAALKKFPEFNASLDGDNLIFKKYYNIGFAADTPNGLVVPVHQERRIRKALMRDREGDDRARRPRRAKASSGPADMQGGCFSISSLGRHRRHVLHADHQRAGSRDPGRVAARARRPVGRQAVRSAPDPAAVAVVGSSRHRRRRGGAFQQLPHRAAR